ncbi:MAG: hypothetical protein QME81_07395 [bacterium]|nr:hypothetical protein [bacterium]
MGLVHRLGHWINFVVVELARQDGRASSATTTPNSVKHYWPKRWTRPINEELIRNRKIRNP